MKKKILFSLLVISVIIAVLAVIKINRNKEVENNKDILEKIKIAFLDLKESKNYYYSVTDILTGSNITKILKDNKFFHKDMNIIFYADIDTKQVYKFNEDDGNYIDVSKDYEGTLESSYTLIYEEPDLIIDLTMTDISIDEISKKVKITEEKYENNIDCYKIKYEYDKKYGTEYIWINQQTMLPIKRGFEKVSGEIFTESKYEITVGSVQDNDVTIPTKY